MDKQYDLYGIISEVVRKETRFLRHYIAKVVDNNDLTLTGRVKVVIDELGFDTPDKAIWCYSRDKNSMSVPVLNDYVEVYFMNGDINRPVYMGVINELTGMVPKNYTGFASDHILFENPENQLNYISFDSKLEVLDILNKILVDVKNNVTKFDQSFVIFDKLQNRITLISNTEAFLKGTTFDTWLTSVLKPVFDLHTHPDPQGGSTGTPATPLTLPTGHLSTKIFGE
jgi:hypothetical protein